MVFGLNEIILICIAFVIASFFMWAAIVSKNENERKAAIKFYSITISVLVYLIIVLLIENDLLTLLSLGTIALFGITGFILILPFGNNPSYVFTNPIHLIDERNTMFSRRELKVGSKEFEDYYRDNPEKKILDDKFRGMPGILGAKASQFNAFHFASSQASFETIEGLYDEVNGDVNPNITPIVPSELSRYIKAWSKKLGALECGITNLCDYHVYSVGGRHERRGIKVSKKHEFAIAFTVEMDKEMVDTAPKAGIVMESGQQYLESGRVAVQIANFIRQLGYDARAHIDGNYEVVCPLVARDAGLGEIGRMGLLMTPSHGPRVRIGVVTANIPLEVDDIKPDYSVIDFCTICKKCADSCPSQAISFDDMKDINGVSRWQINQEACFTLWCSLGTDCGRCVSVCPYSHEKNPLHDIVRYGIKSNYAFRRLALKLDDVFYDRKPKSKEMPNDLKI